MAKNVQLIETGEQYKDEVNDGTLDPHHVVQRPAGQFEDDEQEQDGGEQCDGRVDEGTRLEFDKAVLAEEGRLDQPGCPQAEEDVKDVGPHRVADRHVGQPAAGYYHTAYEFRDGSPGGKNG